VRGLEDIAGRIVLARGVRVILDAELAKLYAVPTRVLLQAVRRNPRRFPADFLFKLENQDIAALRSQNVISNGGRGGRRHALYAFTEHGAIMAASVLASPAAIEMSIYVVRAFVHLRNAALVHAEVRRRLDELERKVGTHDDAIVGLLRAIRELTAPLQRAGQKRRIGFVRD
jgi:hypothetical protein